MSNPKGELTLEGVNCGKEPEFTQTATGKEKVKFSVAFGKSKKVGDTWENGATWWLSCTSFDMDVIDKVRALVHKGTKGINLKAYPDPFTGTDGQVLVSWKVTDISLADGQTQHGRDKANGYVKEPEPVEAGEDDAELCPF